MVTGLVAGAGNQPIVAYDVHDSGQVAASIVSYSHTLAALLGATGSYIQ